MTPYYDSAGITIYHGDCREVLPTLEQADLVLTDPPYGIASFWTGGFSARHGWAKAGQEKEVRNSWDGIAPDAQTIQLCLEAGKNAIVWGGNYFDLPVSRGWLVWNKPERNFTLAEAELAWTTRDMVIRVLDLPRHERMRRHPTQKPLALFKWCLSFFPDARTVLDPFMGSGTTLRAAKDASLKAVGIEVNEAYCEIAARRMEQNVFAFTDAT